MNRIKSTAAFLLLLGIGGLFAQNMPVNVRQQNEPASQYNKMYTIDFRLPAALRQGVIVSFNNPGARLVLTHCRLGDAELWLKKSSEQPVGAQVVHWSLQKGDLILRFNPQSLAGGRQVSLSISDLTPAAATESISLFELTINGSAPVKGALLGSQTVSPRTGQ